jgi:hypothetical protein
MERGAGARTRVSSLGSRYAIENKDQMRPRLCILTTANHREINACTEKPGNGVNGVKSGASLSTPLRYHPDPPLDRLTALFSTATKAIHVTSNPITKHQHSTSAGLERIGPLVADLHPDYVISKRRVRKVESIECVRLNREGARQNLGFSSRPFVLCGLPVKRPASGCLLMNEGTASSFYRSPGIRATSVLGAGSVSPHFSGDARDPTKECEDHFWERRADARHVRDAAGGHAASSSSRSLSTDLRRYDLKYNSGSASLPFPEP